MHLTLGAPPWPLGPFASCQHSRQGLLPTDAAGAPVGLEGNWGSDSGQGRNICLLRHPSPIGHVSFL